MSVVAPFELPCRARIAEFSAMDRAGELEVEGGTRVRFIANACNGFDPEVGVECWILELRPSPLKNNRLYAGEISLSGEHEPTELERQAQGQTIRDAEHELFEELKLDAEEEIEHSDLAWLSVEDKARVAAVLMEGWNAGFPSQALQVASEAMPEALHPHLESIDVDEDGGDLNIAWTPFLGAPSAALTQYEQVIERAALHPHELRIVPELGLVLEVDGEALSPSVTGSMRALVASENALAWRSVERLLGVMPEMFRGQAAESIRQTGYDVAPTGMLARHYAAVAFELFERTDENSDEDEVGNMWGEAGAFCSRCGIPLWSVLDVEVEHVRAAVPLSFPLDRLRILTCAHCCRERGPTYFVQLGDVPRPIVTPEVAALHAGSMAPSDKSFQPLEAVSVWASEAPRYDASGDRVGGCPNLPANEPESFHYPACPCCSDTMFFVARFDEPEAATWSAGIGYMVAFLCARCCVVGTRIVRT